MNLRNSTIAWVENLTPDELTFVRRFLLASGSLKQLAEEYDVSYPTLRARLDQLIAKVQQAGPEQEPSVLRLLVRKMVRDGTLEVDMGRKILKAHDADLEKEGN
jgi:hypothetical protein